LALTRRRGIAAGSLVLTLLAFVPATAPAAGEVAQQGNIRVSFSGSLSPKRLPRKGLAPVSVKLVGRISTVDGGIPPPLTAIEIAINRAGHLDPRAVPYCHLMDIRSASTAQAQRACGASQIGDGSFNAVVSDPEASPYPPRGTVSAFNGLQKGKPVIFLHVYGADPLPTTFTLPLRLSRDEGRFGTVLRGSLPSVDPQIAFVNAISLRLGDSPRLDEDPYLSAGCHAPAGFSQALFPLARASFSFAGGATFTAILERTCTAGL
jgi:hypothetical protein